MHNRISLENIEDEYLYYEKRLRKKRNGKTRVIHAPSPKLKQTQREFADWFYQVKSKEFKRNAQITGFLPGKSIVDGARPHLNKDWTINIDIKDFFPSTNEQEIIKVLKGLVQKRNWFKRFFRPNSTGFKGMSPETLKDYLCLDKGLPQGSPASPIIANYTAIKEVDNEVNKFLDGIGKGMKMSYTRYADDLTISYSGPCDRSYADFIVGGICKIINNKSMYKVHDKKIKIKHKSQRQSVTGIIVNGKDPGATRQLRNKLRAILHNHKKDGAPLTKKVEGMLSFIQSVNPDQYEKLLNNYEEN